MFFEFLGIMLSAPNLSYTVFTQCIYCCTRLEKKRDNRAISCYSGHKIGVFWCMKHLKEIQDLVDKGRLSSVCGCLFCCNIEHDKIHGYMWYPVTQNTIVYLQYVWLNLSYTPLSMINCAINYHTNDNPNKISCLSIFYPGNQIDGFCFAYKCIAIDYDMFAC